MLQLVALSVIASLSAAQPTLLDSGYREMYNLEFDQAHRSFQEWERMHPDDPLGPASNAAAYLFAEFARLHILQSELFVRNDSFLKRETPAADPATKRKFDGALARAEQLAARNPEDGNSQFAAILTHGLRADYLALIEKRYFASLNDIKAGRALAERLLAKDPTYYDAYLAIGVESYTLGLKPLPVRWVLRLGGARTDKEEGIRKLRLTAEKGRYLLPYARLLLAVAALRDHDRGRARNLLQYLHREFPANPLYAEELARLQQ
ncbi:MAG: hypothetical protein ACM336_16630 [Acidobacteriota bacterium]